MKIINCVIADDEELAREIIENYILRLDHLKLVATCADGVQVYNTLREHSQVDLLFLDIKMPQLNGIELLQTLKKPPAVIMTTAYREYALKTYEYNVIDYLLKPISFERFLKSINKYELLKSLPEAANHPGLEKTTIKPAFIDVKADKRMIRLPLEHIFFIEGLKDYVKIHTAEMDIVTYQTLNSLEEQLSASGFVRVHRSFIVSAAYINAYSSTHLEIGRRTIPIGSFYKDAVSKYLKI